MSDDGTRIHGFCVENMDRLAAERDNFASTARALLARAETAERHVEHLLAENARLRAVLSSLCDATTDTMAGWIVRTGSDKWVAYVSARAAAVSVLKGPLTND